MHLLIPGAIIAILSTVAIISAPIARYSTRVGIWTEPKLVSGTLATHSHRSINDALVKWNNTIERFNSAGLPLNQLMDFLPDNTIDWKYSEPEWNNSWSASCHWSERTPIKLYAMGNATSGKIWDIFPGISAVFSGDIRETKYASGMANPGPYRGNLFLDKLLFISLQTHPNVSFNATPGFSTNSRPFHFTIAAFHLKNTPAKIADDGSVTWGTGPVEQSWYTMASCDIERVATRTPDKLDNYAQRHIAYPWTKDYNWTVRAFGTHYHAPFTEQSFRKEPIYHPSGQDLFRFYQAYLATKDVQDYERAERVISVAVPSVELSVPVLAVLLIYLAMIGLAAFWFVTVKRLPTGASVPRTKVEWMAQGMRESLGREVHASYLCASWGQIQASLRDAKIVTVRDPWQRLYNTIQPGQHVEQHRSMDGSLKA